MQYELSMSIGDSLDIGALLQRALSSFLHQLDCVAGAVHLIDCKGEPYTHAMPTPEAISRALRRFSEYRTQSDLALDDPELTEAMPVLLPNDLCADDAEQEHACVVGLPGVGFMLLQRHGEPLEPCLLDAIRPLLAKLAHACQLCLQNAELETERLQLCLERNILRTFVDHTPTIIFAIDITGTLTLIEGMGLESLGMKAELLRGRSIFDVYGDSERFIASIKSALRGEQATALLQLRGLSFDAHL